MTLIRIAAFSALRRLIGWTLTGCTLTGCTLIGCTLIGYTLIGCGTEADGFLAGADMVGVQVAWLDGAPRGIPADVTTLRIVVFDESGIPIDDSTRSVSRLPTDGDEAPYYAQPNLPINRLFRLRVEAFGDPPMMGVAGPLLYLAEIGPLVLGEGERRFVRVQMYPVATPATLKIPNGSRALHTATPLGDGRVLIAGGFDEVTSVPCDTALPNRSRCFELTATDDAILFDTATGETFAPRGGPMLQARGGHTATLLADGRVLLAGGSEKARLTLVAGEGDTFVPVLAPIDADGNVAAHDTFELFDPLQLALPIDSEANGDRERGDFYGTDGTRAPGLLNQERFMHAAARIPNEARRDAQVLLVGGMGGNGAEVTWEVFDARRAGGPRVFVNPNGNLDIPRPMPSVASLSGISETRVWIIGGGIATTEEELAVVWSPNPENFDDPNGRITPASETSFASDGPHPEWNLSRPAVTTLTNESYALVLGWLGARCDDGGAAFAEDLEGTGTTVCDQAEIGAPSSFVLAGVDGETTPVEAATERAFGALVSLDDDEGTVVATGGFGSLALDALDSIEVFAGATVGGELGEYTAPVEPTDPMIEARAMHTSTALPGSGVLTVGGLRVQDGEVELVETAEVLFLYPQPSM